MPEKFKYVLTGDDLEDSESRWFVESGIVYTTDYHGGSDAFLVDFNRTTKIRGHKKRDGDYSIQELDIVGRDIFGEDKYNLIKKHYAQSMAAVGQYGVTMPFMINQPFFLAPTKAEKRDEEIFIENGEVFFKARVKEFDIYETDESGMPEGKIGTIRGPVVALCKLEKNGFRLQSISTDSIFIRDMNLGNIQQIERNEKDNNVLGIDGIPDYKLQEQLRKVAAEQFKRADIYSDNKIHIESKTEKKEAILYRIVDISKIEKSEQKSNSPIHKKTKYNLTTYFQDAKAQISSELRITTPELNPVKLLSGIMANYSGLSPNSDRFERFRALRPKFENFINDCGKKGEPISETNLQSFVATLSSNPAVIKKASKELYTAYQKNMEVNFKSGFFSRSKILPKKELIKMVMRQIATVRKESQEPNPIIYIDTARDKHLVEAIMLCCAAKNYQCENKTKYQIDISDKTSAFKKMLEADADLKEFDKKINSVEVSSSTEKVQALLGSGEDKHEPLDPDQPDSVLEAESPLPPPKSTLVVEVKAPDEDAASLGRAHR